MPNENACSDCGKALVKGFIPDTTYGQVNRSHWHPGDPKKAKFFGIKAGVKADWSETVPILAYRCAGCGLLKFYAISEPD